MLDYPKLKEQEKFKLYKLGKESTVFYILNILIGQHLLHTFYKSSTVVGSLQGIPDYHENLSIYIFINLSPLIENQEMMLPTENGSFKFRNTNSLGSLKLRHYLD